MITDLISLFLVFNPAAASPLQPSSCALTPTACSLQNWSCGGKLFWEQRNLVQRLHFSIALQGSLIKEGKVIFIYPSCFSEFKSKNKPTRNCQMPPRTSVFSFCLPFPHADSDASRRTGDNFVPSQMGRPLLPGSHIIAFSYFQCFYMWVQGPQMRALSKYRITSKQVSVGWKSWPVEGIRLDCLQREGKERQLGGDRSR